MYEVELPAWRLGLAQSNSHHSELSTKAIDFSEDGGWGVWNVLFFISTST